MHFGFVGMGEAFRLTDASSGNGITWDNLEEGKKERKNEGRKEGRNGRKGKRERERKEELGNEVN